MKYIVASDIHGSSYYAQKIKDIFINENADKLILLGDLYYHGPRNDIPVGHDAKETVKILNSLKDNIIAVRGNCDADVDLWVSEFEMKEMEILEIAGKKYLFNHGVKYSIDNPPVYEYVDVCVYGHVHTGFITKEYDMYFLNPGSTTIPKGGTKNSYMILEEGNVYLKNIDTEEIIDEITIR
jgi:putative phosphoesterase